VAVVLVLMGMAFPSLLLALPLDQTISVEAPAACHQESPSSNTPMGQHHDCCLIGHNQAMPVHAAGLIACANVLVIRLVAPARLVQSEGRPEPGLSSFDPPFSTLSLRI
jgi:hypothetical protein